MSTIRHPAQQNLWWYAVAAVLAGAVVSLMMLTLRSNGPAPADTSTETGTTHFRHYSAGPACYAGHPVSNIELPSCVYRVP
jgi:hypothetical protein